MAIIYSKSGTDEAISAATGALTPEDVGADPAGTAAAAIAALGLGTAAQSDATNFAPASSAAYPVQQVTLTGDLAYTLPVDAPADQVISVVFTQDGTGGHTVTYGGDAVTVDATPGASTLVEFWPGGAVTYPGAAGAVAAIEHLGTSAKTKVVVIGSSNVAGMLLPSPSTQSWPELVAARLAASHDFVRLGVSGKDPLLWVTPDATGATELDTIISTHRPHILIASLAPQNLGGRPASLAISAVERAKAICDSRGVRFIGATPYNSESYTPSQIDDSRWIAETLKARGIPLLDFAPLWGELHMPDSIDSGDGLHLTPSGHLAQSYHVPSDMLSLDCGLDHVKLPLTQRGVVMPAVDQVALLLTPGPLGSFTLGFRVTCPPVEKLGVTLAGFGPANWTRIRIVNSNEVVVVGALTSQSATIDTAGGTFHVALAYDAVRGAASFYVDGVLVSSTAAPLGVSWPNVALGTPDGGHFEPSEVAEGYTFSNVTLHATTLTEPDLARLVGGDVPVLSLHYAAALTDGIGRPQGGKMAAAFGSQTAIQIGRRLDPTAPEWSATLTVTPSETSATITASSLASDASRYVEYHITTDGTTWTPTRPAGASFTLSALAASTTYATVKLRARDLAGNSTVLDVPSFVTTSATPKSAFTTFSGDTIGQAPAGWTPIGGSGFAVVKADGTSPTGKAVLLKPATDGHYALRWDAVPFGESITEIVARCRFEGVAGNAVLRVALGADSPITSYYLSASYDQLAIVKVVAGAGSFVKEALTFAALSGWVWVRLRYEGGTASARIWADGSAEPATWTISGASAAPSAGSAGLAARWAAAICYVDAVGAAWGGGTAPMS